MRTGGPHKALNRLLKCVLKPPIGGSGEFLWDLALLLLLSDRNLWPLIIVKFFDFYWHVWKCLLKWATAQSKRFILSFDLLITVKVHFKNVTTKLIMFKKKRKKKVFGLGWWGFDKSASLCDLYQIRLGISDKIDGRANLSSALVYLDVAASWKVNGQKRQQIHTKETRYKIHIAVSNISERDFQREISFVCHSLASAQNCNWLLISNPQLHSGRQGERWPDHACLVSVACTHQWEGHP